MPAIGLAAWAAIASLAATGVTTGLAAANQPSQPSTSDLAKQEQQREQQQANQQALQRREAILGAQGQGQAQVGGSLTDPGFQQFVSQLAGYPGYGGTGTQTPGVPGGQAQNKSGGEAGPVNMAEILRSLGADGSNISGGGTAPSQGPQQWFQLSSPVV